MEQYEEMEIVFLEDDSAETIARKTFEIHVGTSELKPQLKKLGIEYTKVVKGLYTFYCLTGRGINQTLKIRL